MFDFQECVWHHSVLQLRLPFQKYSAPHFYIFVSISGVLQHTCVSFEMTASTVQIREVWGYFCKFSKDVPGVSGEESLRQKMICVFTENTSCMHL